jgi:antitoxin CcdA
VSLIRRARALKLNLSVVLETALEKAVRETERSAWLAENRDAISEYRTWVKEHGVFSDGRRRF